MTETRAPEPTPTTPPEAPVSYDEFLKWADEDTRAEWIDGEVLTMSPASATHQRLVRFLSNLFGIWLEERKAGEVFVVPFQMKLDVRPSGREPDVLVVKEAHRDRIRDSHLEGPADLVVEVVSPESGARDRGEKFYEYESAGIPEYWIVDPQREELEVYRLEGERYRVVFMGAEGRVDSAVIDGFWIEADWLWQEELPPVLDVLSKLGLA